jgi:hypothetical protein
MNIMVFIVLYNMRSLLPEIEMPKYKNLEVSTIYLQAILQYIGITYF